VSDVEQQRPLVQEVSIPLSAPQAFEIIRDNPYSFFLDSGMDHGNLGRYSFIGCDPFLVFKSRGTDITLDYGTHQETRSGNPFDVLGELLDRYALAPPSSPIPFTGGAVGYFGYDLCHFIERLPSTTVDDLELPECQFAFYGAIVGFDHLEGRAYIAATGFPETEERSWQGEVRERIENLSALLEQALAAKEYPVDEPAVGTRLRANFTPEEYIAAVAQAREYIAAGDIFQVNLSQRFDVDLTIEPYELYRRLRRINPAPFASYLNFADVTIASASPERFLRLDGDLVETRPMKGTRPRGGTAGEDDRLAAELVNSVKDRAENVMIVDLERNDLGRVCRYGTVKVRELYTLEKYSTVFQLTSTVEGRLQQGRNRIDLLKATFPGGSITGAPKVRSMEIIDEMEPTKRGVYTGSIGYLGFDGRMDINIVIRTFIIKGGKAYFQVGGGIIYDSGPEAEYRETLDKAKALMDALELHPVTELK
jgi:para-aminobenzoate synthetase component 1